MTAVSSTYIKGLSRDIAISKSQNDSLYYALNLDLVTDIGNSTGTIHNHKGNKFDFKLPERVLSIYKLTISDLPISGVISGQILINGSPYTPVNITISSTTTIEDLYNQIIPQLPSSGVIVHYNNSNIVFVNTEENYAYQIDISSPLFPYLNLGLKVNSIDEPVIIGWSQIGEGIALLTTQKKVLSGGNFVLNSSKTPLNIPGQIWYINYDDISDSVTDLDPNGALRLDIHLKYHGILNFSLGNAIYKEALGRYEKTDVANLYFTDNYNQPRVFNLLNPQHFAVDEKMLDWKPSVDFSVPIIQKVLNSGTLKVGSYQFAYRLKTTDGGVTQFSPLSKLINITDKNEFLPYIEYFGADADTFSTKSIKFKVEGLDLNFDFVEFAVIEYNVKDIPLIYIFKELPITSKKVEVVYSGNENKFPIQLAELVSPRINFDRVKTFTQKKNRLYPANTRKSNFEIKGWDTRSYRFDSNGQYRLYNQNGTFITGTGLDTQLQTLSDNQDAVNPYNDDSGTVYGILGSYNDSTRDQWFSIFQYKYKQDGVTFGGEGVNIDYEIISEEYLGDTTIYTSKNGVPFNSVGNLPTPTNINFGITDQEYDIGGFADDKNIYIQETLRSHHIGEVYRYGIVLLNSKGEESFVNWIADIRIPEPREGSQFALSRTFGTDLYLRTILIRFELRNISTLIANNPGVTAIKIVRKERDVLNRNRHGMGVLMAPLGGKVMISPDSFGIDSDPGTTILQLTRIQNEDNGGNRVIQDKTTPNGFGLYADTLSNSDYNATTGNRFPRPRYNFDFDKNLTDYTYSGRLPILKSPEIDFGKYGNQATHFNVVSRYDWEEVAYWRKYVSAATAPAHRKESKAFYLFLTSVVDSGKTLYSNNMIDINKTRELDIQSIVPQNFSSFMDRDYHHIGTYRRYYDTADGTGILPSAVEHRFNTLASLGAKMLFTEVNGTKLESDINGDYKDGNINARTRVNVVSLCSYNSGQYGGPWRSSRYQDEYRITCEIVPISVLTNPQTVKVAGDVFTTFYTSVVSFMHWKQEGTSNEDYDRDVVPARTPTGLGAIYGPMRHFMSSLAIGFPCQTMINVKMRYGKYWNKDQVTSTPTIDSLDFANFLVDEYNENESYSQENNLKSHLSKPFNAKFVEEQPFTVWVSENKLDGEKIDNWRNYLINNQKDVEGLYGPINKIASFKDVILAYQNRGIARILSEEISSVANTDGQVFQIGIGNILVSHEYVSKETGTIHQHSVVVGPDSIYHFDARLKKMFMFSKGMVPITDIKGLHAFFKENLAGRVLVDDQPLLSRSVHGEYDSKYNKVYYTFSDSFYIESKISQFPILPVNPGTILTFVDCTVENPNHLKINKDYTINGVKFRLVGLTQVGLLWTVNLLYLGGNWSNIDGNVKWFYLEDKFTIAYNRFLEAFESFYSFTPNLYLGTGKRFLSANPYDMSGSVYSHNKGRFGVFYDQPIEKLKAEFFVNPDPTSKATFRTNYFEFWSQVRDENDVDIFDESISGLKVTNDYQSTEDSLLPLNDVSLKRFERTWGVNLIRDYSAVYPLKPYLRDKYIKVYLEYDNANNNSFVLHNWNTDITLSYPITQ